MNKFLFGLHSKENYDLHFSTLTVKTNMKIEKKL